MSLKVLLKLFHPRFFLVLITSFSLSHAHITFANESQNLLPSPLDLKTAVSFAKDHPRTKLSPEQQILSRIPQPLFLGCHNLTFNNIPIIDAQRNSVSTHLVNPVVQQKLLILQAYFDVLLADSSVIAINEDMAGAFIAYDRAKIRQELKQYSELTVARLEARYQEVRQQNFSAQATQRLTRSILAQAINHPDDLSSDLNSPTLIQPLKNQADATELYTQALKNNSWITKLKETNNSEQMALIEMDLRQQILELTLRLNVLNATSLRAETEAYRRDLDLDLSRTLYEMEVKATLGRSMTLQSKARMEEERVKYCQTLSWAKLNALIGLPILTQPKETLQISGTSEANQ